MKELVKYSKFPAKNAGFTLLEVLLAIAIFAVVSLTSFTIFNTVLKSDESSQFRTERINEIQRAFLLIERDIVQIARRTVRLNGEEPQKGFLHTDSDSFSTSESTLAFVRNGWTNPGLLLPRSDMQSVAYQLNETTLERLHYNFVDAVQGQEPKVRPLIREVKSLTFEFYYEEKWQSKLPETILPSGVAIEIDTEDYGIIRREFLIAGDQTRKKIT